MKRSNVRGAKGPCHLQSLRRKEGKDEMTKASIDLQDLKRRIYVKGKAEPSWRFGRRRHLANAQKRKGFGWERRSRLTRGCLRLSGETRQAESRPSRIGPISLGMKQMGARSAGCVKKTSNRHAVREMKEGPSGPPCRGRPQAATSCFSQKLR